MTGTLVYKVENRHRLGTEIAPQQLAGEIGYAGLTDLTFSNAGWALTNFFWQQELLDGRLGFVVGLVDVTDYIDDYGMVSPRMAWPGPRWIDPSASALAATYDIRAICLGSVSIGDGPQKKPSVPG